MSLLHPALLIGLVLAIIPIVLHLLMRARPKRLIFPALRLLQQRKNQNSRRMRLRHFWLLLLRMLVIAGFVIALSRPTLPPANYALRWFEWMWLIGIGIAAIVLDQVLQRQLAQRIVAIDQRQVQQARWRSGLIIAALLLAALLVAWPYQRRLAAEIKAPAQTILEDLPVAALFLCDTSGSLQYLQDGKSRLAVAQAMARTHLERMPTGSKAAVITGSGELPALMTPDLSAVQNRLEALVAEPVTAPLNERLRSALRLHLDDRERVTAERGAAGDRFLREIYVLTDLAASAWQPDAAHGLRDELAATPDIGLYFLDVGAEQPTNVGFVQARPLQPAISQGGLLEIEASVRATGAVRSEQTVELWVRVDDQPLTKRDQQTITIDHDRETGLRFRLEGLTGQLIQGELRLVTTDPLEYDNTIPFTVRVLPPLNVLAVVDQRAYASFWTAAIDGINDGGAAYKSTVITPAQWDSTALDKYDVVCWLHVTRPTEAMWTRLKAFVETGGGLFVALGASSTAVQPANGLDPLAYNAEAAQALLPAKLKASLNFTPAQSLVFREATHPLTTRLEQTGTLSELNEVDFYRHWRVEPVESSQVLASWPVEIPDPALVERHVGRGRTLLFASSVDSLAWSELPRRWPFVILVDQWLQGLARQATTPLTFLAGDRVTVPLPAETIGGAALLRAPDLTQRRVELVTNSRELTVPNTSVLGNYQIIRAGKTPAEIVAAFSLQAIPEEADLKRLRPSELDELLGEKRYGLARDPEQLERSVNTGRLGQEVYGLLMGLLIFVFVTEQTTATWFYRTDEA